jgi:hypothetical protein
MATELTKSFSMWPVELHKKLTQYLPYPDLAMLMWTNHYFQNLLDDNVLRAALMELEMGEYVSKDFDFEEVLPCYTCLLVLPQEDFCTVPSYSEYPTMPWGGPGTDERACRKCDRKTGGRVK